MIIINLTAYTIRVFQCPSRQKRIFYTTPSANVTNDNDLDRQNFDTSTEKNTVTDDGKV